MKKGTSSTNELKSTGSSGAHSPSLLPPVHWGMWEVADLGGTPPGRCVYSDKSLNLYEPQFSQVESGEGDVGC